MKTIIVGMPQGADLAKRIAKRLRAPFSPLWSVPFPDGESHLRFTAQVKGRHVVLVQSMHPAPNDGMIECIFAINTARELGAKKVTLVAPYLAYMRQDKRFTPLECQSNRIMARLLSCADRIVTVDPHLHRIDRLGQIFGKTRTACLSANALIGEYLRKQHPGAVIVGPDAESYQWAERIAEHLRAHAVVLRKKRYSSYTVRIKVPDELVVKGRDVVIVDDIISTGHTIMEPAKQMLRRGARRVYVVAVHGIFASDALRRLQRMGLRVITTNTIATPVSRIDVAPLIADALK